jgi:DNA-binding NarL/FixJ family response regulator
LKLAWATGGQPSSCDPSYAVQMSGVPRSKRKTVVPRPGVLTTASRQIAQLLGDGMPTDEIAAAMKLDREAAREQGAAVLQKLSLRSRRQIGELMPDRPLSANGFLL